MDLIWFNFHLKRWNATPKFEVWPERLFGCWSCFQLSLRDINSPICCPHWNWIDCNILTDRWATNYYSWRINMNFLDENQKWKKQKFRHIYIYVFLLIANRFFLMRRFIITNIMNIELENVQSQRFSCHARWYKSINRLI